VADSGTTPTACNCGPGVWGYCDTCETDRWVWHSCPGGCDDVTCVDGTTCQACSTGVLCPVHDADGGFYYDPTSIGLKRKASTMSEPKCVEWMDRKGQPVPLGTERSDGMVPWPEKGWRPPSWRTGTAKSDRFPDHHEAHRHELYHHLDDFGDECEHTLRLRCQCRVGHWCCDSMTAEDLTCDACRKWCGGSDV
jgi:hypothetical protein